ncbi:MAG: Uma2 family endonuclease [Microcoleaceae cyanobacterium MO_207.B10]|nr:Uma2 family endonuclease [Microcoleaceae cyanobacterium MO_207.B10]
MVLDKAALKYQPLWKKSSTITQGKTVKLIVEVISTNWRNYYGHKLIDYQGLEIPNIG